MKKLSLFFTIFVLAFFVGCTQNPNFNKVALQTSSPIFLQKSSEKQNVFISFANDSAPDWDINNGVESRLKLAGINVVEHNNLSNIKIVGVVNYFRRSEIQNNNPSLSFGVGAFGSGFGIGASRGINSNDYIYDSQIAFEITTIDSKGASKTYQTNLYLQTTPDVISFKNATELFNDKISGYVLNLLNSTKE